MLFRSGELEAEEKNLKSRIGDLEDKIKKQKNNQVTEQQVLRSKIDRLNAENESKLKKIRELEASIKIHEGIQANARVSDTTAHENLKSEIRGLEADASEKDKHIKKLQKDIENLQTELNDLTQLIEADKPFKEQVEKNEKQQAAELKELNKQLYELNQQIADLKKKISETDELLIKHDVLTKEQLAQDQEKALEIETELYAQPERTELDVSLGGDGWIRYLEVKHRNISTDKKRQQLFNNCNWQYDASQQSVDNKWGVLCIGTSHDDNSIKSLQKKCGENDYTFIDLTGKKPGEVVALIKNPHEKKPFFFIKKESICKKSMRYFEDEFPKQKYQELVSHITTHNNEDNSQDSIDKRIRRFYSSLEIEQEKKYKLAGLLAEFWAVNYFTHLTKSVENFSIKNTGISIVASPASNDSGF